MCMNCILLYIFRFINIVMIMFIRGVFLHQPPTWHLTHFNIDVVKKALENDVILIKLPPHVTDVMQPLDVGMFAPLKKVWERLLNANIGISGPKTLLNKSTFVNMLCSIWTDSYNTEKCHCWI